MTIFLKKNIIVIICLILFIIPFFWFSYGELDLGGDSTRLYFYDPVSWLKNIALFSTNALSGMGADNPNFMIVPFLLCLAFLKVILLNNSYLLNCFFSGLLLSGSFLFMYLSINELLKKENKNCNLIKYSSITGGLFFTFSPIIIYEWQKASYYFNHIFAYPLMFFLFLKYINTKQYKYLCISILITLIFSVNFSFSTSPWFFAFFLPIFLFLFLHSAINKKITTFLKGFALFGVVFLLIQSFQFLPQINNILDYSNPNSSVIFSNDGMNNRGLGYFLSIQPYVKLIYNITNQPQYDISTAFNHPIKDTIFKYGIKYQYLFFVYILIISFGWILIIKMGSKKERMMQTVLMGIFLILTFFMTANVNDFLLQFYKNLFFIPGFAMFRSFYTKFGLVFIFFYALLIGMSLYYLLNFVKNKLSRGIILICMSFLIIFNAWPLISGQIVNGILWQSKNVRTTTKMDGAYAVFINSVKDEKLDGKYLSLPLTNESYQLLQGQDGGAYFGPSSISVLAGKPDFPGLGSFLAGGNEQVLKYLDNKDYKSLNNLFSFLNIEYIFHNSDNYIYDNFPNYPYSEKLKKIFPDQDSITQAIQKLNYKKNIQIGNKFNLYTVKNNFLPHFYTPEKNIVSSGDTKNIPSIISDPDYQIRSAVFFKKQNEGKDDILKQVQDDTMSPKVINNDGAGPKVVNDGATTPVVEFKKIDPTKYRVVIHGASGQFPLVFSESFHDGWKMYPGNIQPATDNSRQNLDSYKILDGNVDDQAGKDELAEYVSKGWVTSLGDGKGKEINHQKWNSDAQKEQADYKENYNIDFISKNFQGTIQNDNLPSGHFWETWFKKPIENNANHLMANGYANSWVIDVDKICSENPSSCKKNPPCEIGQDKSCISLGKDGTYDIEFVVEFWPQRLFYVGLGISGATLFGCLGYLGWDFISRRRKAKKDLLIK